MEDESLLLDPQMDYSQVAGLSSEVKERLYAVRPITIVRHWLHSTAFINLAKYREPLNAWRA
jgi:hypothetical protein